MNTGLTLPHHVCLRGRPEVSDRFAVLLVSARVRKADQPLLPDSLAALMNIASGKPNQLTMACVLQ
jgi:hypothetical protein